MEVLKFQAISRDFGGDRTAAGHRADNLLSGQKKTAVTFVKFLK